MSFSYKLRRAALLIPHIFIKTGCCIYKKPKEFGESSSSEDDSDDECDHCKGHVDKKKATASTPTDSNDGSNITGTLPSNEKSEHPPPSDPPPP